MYINSEPQALLSYQQNAAVLKDLLPETDYRFGTLLMWYLFLTLSCVCVCGVTWC